MVLKEWQKLEIYLYESLLAFHPDYDQHNHYRIDSTLWEAPRLVNTGATSFLS